MAESYDMGSLEQLWESAGGSPQWAPTMAGIAIAESTGDPNSNNYVDNSGKQTSWGLWQISNGTHSSPAPAGENPDNPQVNAKMAVAKLNSQGTGAWRGDAVGSVSYYQDHGGPLTPQQLNSVMINDLNYRGSVPVTSAVGPSTGKVTPLSSSGGSGGGTKSSSFLITFDNLLNGGGASSKVQSSSGSNGFLTILGKLTGGVFGGALATDAVKMTEGQGIATGVIDSVEMISIRLAVASIGVIFIAAGLVIIGVGILNPAVRTTNKGLAAHGTFAKAAKVVAK